MNVAQALTLALGLALGGLVSWALLRSRNAAELATAHAQAQAQANRVSEVTRDFSQRLADQRELHLEQLADLKGDHERLTNAFESLSAKALAQNSSAFLVQAEQRLTRAHEVNTAELAKREQAVKALVDPLSKTLDAVRAEMTAAERARAEAHGALAEQVKSMASTSDALRGQTTQLVTALRAPHVRGRWGELQLRRVVEAAGMLNHVDFSEQVTVDSGPDLLRPDMVVRLPGDKQVVVDAKVSLASFLEAVDTEDDSMRANRLRSHAKHVRTHVDSLASKSYWEQLPHTPEFVVMFVPADPMLSAALDTDPDLLEYAFTRNVVVATPATLVALLRTVAYTWRQERLAEEAHRVFTTGRELHKRLGTFGGHLNDVGKRLNSAVTAFNRLNRSIDSNLLPQMKRFSELQGFDEPFELTAPVEVLAVAAEKPELFTQEVEGAE